jgi:hypothetical protein
MAEGLACNGRQESDLSQGPPEPIRCGHLSLCSQSAPENNQEEIFTKKYSI